MRTRQQIEDCFIIDQWDQPYPCRRCGHLHYNGCLTPEEAPILRDIIKQKATELAESNGLYNDLKQLKRDNARNPYIRGTR